MSRVFNIGLLVLFAASGTVLFSQTAEKNNGYRVWYGCDIPGRGYPDSLKVEEGAYVAGRKEGKWIRYHRDGKTPKLICYYENNRPTGKYEAFNENGTPKEAGTFRKNFHCDTLRRHYANGQLEYIGWYNEFGKEHGIVRYYYPNGREEVAYTAVNGIPRDTVKRYYENGELKEIIVFDSEGAEKFKQFYVQQNPPPPSTEKAPEVIRGCVTGSGFKPDGYNKIYNADNEIWQEGAFRESKLWDGKVYIYDTDGILTQVKIYKEGVFHSFGQL